MSIEVHVSTYVSPFKDLYKSAHWAHCMHIVFIIFEIEFTFYSLCLSRVLCILKLSIKPYLGFLLLSGWAGLFKLSYINFHMVSERKG